MEINPQSVILPDAPLINHTIRVDIQWTPSSLPGWILYYDLDCDQNNHSSTTSTTGTNTYSLTSPGYENYQIQFRFGSLDPNQPTITGTYQLYFDEQLIRSASFQAQPASYSNFAYFNTHYQSPVLTDYTFSIYTSEICPGRYEDIYLTTSRNCNATAEINTEQDSITLTIETGKEFVSFYKNNQKKDTVTFMYHELGSVYLRQDSIYTGTASINVNIKSNWTGIIKYQQLVINPQEQFQIRVPDQPIIVFSGGVGGLKIEPHSSSICAPYISENLRYTALIKKGSSRGLLYDYDTRQSGDTLTNLTPQEDGEKYLDFITEGEILNEEDTVLIKIFANDENIDTTEAVVIIYPNNLDVQILPPVIQHGDTASVVLKKRGVNGLEDFTADKLFNVEIVQGLEYGLILDSLSNDTLTIFSNIPQGFKIIAKDSTGIDSTRIRIKVSTEESGFPVAGMIRNNTRTNKKEIVDENQKSDDEIITPDWIIPGPILLEGFGDVVVRVEEWCANLTKCDGEIILPQVVLNPVPNGYNGRDLCAKEDRPLEAVQALWGEEMIINQNLCYNSNYNRIWYLGNSSLVINYILAICEENVPNGVEWIDNWMGLSEELTCNELEDIFWAMINYGGRALPPTPGYYLREVINAHEGEHINDYQDAINLAIPGFNQALQNFIKQCSDFNDEATAKLSFIDFLMQTFSKLKEDAKNNFRDIKQMGNERSGDYETDVQHRRSVIDEINRQIVATNTARNCNITLIDYFY